MKILDSAIIKWLLEGDISIQYQVHRDLLNTEKKSLQDQIAKTGWGAEFLSNRLENGHWGRKFYQPKWISTHYTLLDLKNLGISPNIKEIQETLAMIFKESKDPDGGILPIGLDQKCDVCLNGMVLNYASYFGSTENDLKSVIDFILLQHMKDGGFNCQYNRKGAVHSSLHSTLSVLEGILEYIKGGYQYKVKELQEIESKAIEFILQHKLYQSDKTGATISKQMLMLSFPSRWKYDILRALDYFHFKGIKFDKRMDDALTLLLNKQRKDGKWPLQAKHPGQTHFDMEQAGKASRWNTLRVLRVLKHFDLKNPSYD